MYTKQFKPKKTNVGVRQIMQRKYPMLLCQYLLANANCMMSTDSNFIRSSTKMMASTGYLSKIIFIWRGRVLGRLYVGCIKINICPLRAIKNGPRHLHWVHFLFTKQQTARMSNLRSSHA